MPLAITMPFSAVQGLAWAAGASSIHTQARQHGNNDAAHYASHPRPRFPRA